MAERKWITREEIAEIHEARAESKLKSGNIVHGVGEAMELMDKAQGIRDIETIYSKHVDSHIYNTRQANKTGRLAR